MNDSVQEQIMKLAAEAGNVPLSQVSMESHIQNDLNFDSLGVVEFAMEVEDAFSINVPDDQMVQLLTIGDVVRYVEAQLSAAGNHT